jgi:transposase
MMLSQSGKVCVPAALCLGSRSATPNIGSGLGRWRWVVERTFCWLNQSLRLRLRYEKRADIHEAFLSLGCALICWCFLRID